MMIKGRGTVWIANPKTPTTVRERTKAERCDEGEERGEERRLG